MFIKVVTKAHGVIYQRVGSKREGAKFLTKLKREGVECLSWEYL